MAAFDLEDDALLKPAGIDLQARRFFNITIYVSLAAIALIVSALFLQGINDLAISLVGLLVAHTAALLTARRWDTPLGYHIYLASTNLHFIIVQLATDYNYIATATLYPILILVSVFFFRNRWITLLYTLMGLFSCLITITTTSNLLFRGKYELLIEVVVTLTGFAIFYSTSDILINGLRRTNASVREKEQQLNVNKVFIETQNAQLKRQNESLTEAERILSSKNEQLERYIESNMQLENFAYIASHDLQAPLTGILALSEMLAATAADKLDYAEGKSLDLIHSSASSMQRLVRSLLEYSRADSQDLLPETLDPAALLNALLAELSIVLRDKDALVLTEGFLPGQVTADPVKLKQLFQNLISNGIKFSHPSRSPVIRVGCRDGEHEWIFHFSDNGIGIPEDHLEEIFVMFRRLHDDKSYQGSGIGLALCKKLVEQHGGRIWVESQVGVGTDFYFSLPK